VSARFGFTLVPQEQTSVPRQRVEERLVFDSAPAPRGLQERAHVASRIAAVREVEIEVVGEAMKLRFRQRVDVAKGASGPHVRDPVRLRLAEVGAEAVEPYRTEHAGRLQVRESGNDPRLLIEPARIFAGESKEQVPVRGDPEASAPLEKLDVLQLRTAFAHQFEEIGVQALDPRLDL